MCAIKEELDRAENTIYSVIAIPIGVEIKMMESLRLVMSLCSKEHQSHGLIKRNWWLHPFLVRSSISLCAFQVVWLMILLGELGSNLGEVVTVLVDNVSTINLAKNSFAHG